MGGRLEHLRPNFHSVHMSPGYTCFVTHLYSPTWLRASFLPLASASHECCEVSYAFHSPVVIAFFTQLLLCLVSRSVFSMFLRVAKRMKIRWQSLRREGRCGGLRFCLILVFLCMIWRHSRCSTSTRPLWRCSCVVDLFAGCSF